MNRRNFFKRIGTVSVGIVVAPVVTVEVIKKPLFGVIPTPTPIGFVFEGEDVVSYIEYGNRVIPLNTRENIIKFWRETGMLVFKPYCSPIYHKTNPVTRTKKEIEELFMPII